MNHKVEKEKEFEEDLMPAQLEKLEEGGGTLSREGGIIGGVDCLLKGGMTSSVWCPPPFPPKMKTLHNIPISKCHIRNTLSQYFDISNIHSWHIHKTFVIHKFSISQYPLNIIISMPKITISQCRNSQLSKYPNVNIKITAPIPNVPRFWYLTWHNKKNAFPTFSIHPAATISISIF